MLINLEIEYFSPIIESNVVLRQPVPGIFTEVRSKAGSRVLLRGSVEKVVLAVFSSVYGLRQRRLSSELPGTAKK